MRFLNFIIVLFVFISSYGVGQELYTWSDYNKDGAVVLDASLTWPEINNLSKRKDDLPSGYSGENADSIYALVIKITYFSYKDNHVDHILTLNRLLTNYKNNLSKNLSSILNMHMAGSYRALKNYELAKSFYLEALDESLGLDNYTYCASEIGLMFKELGDFEKAIEYYEYALKRTKNDQYRVAYLNSLGYLHFLNKDFKKAEFYYRQGEKYFSDHSHVVDSLQFYIIQSNMLSLYMIKGQEDVELYKKRLISRDAHEQLPIYFRAEIYFKFFDLAKRRSNCIEMNEYIDSLSGIMRTYKDPDNTGKLLYKNWLYHSSCGSMETANEFAQRYSLFRDSLFIQEQNLRSKVEQIQIANYKEQYRSAETARSNLERSNSILRILFYLSGFTFIILLILSIVVFRNRRIREKRKAHYLNVKRTLLSEQQKAARLEAEKQEKELDNKRLELKSMIQGTELEAELVQELIERLNFIRKNGDEGELAQVIQFLQSKQQARKIDEVIASNQDLVDTQFKSVVKEKYPDLTESEFQLLIMLRIGLTTKEIALFRNVEPSSVRIYKNRLKNKLKLSKNTDLEVFIKEL